VGRWRLDGYATSVQQHIAPRSGRLGLVCTGEGVWGSRLGVGYGIGKSSGFRTRVSVRVL
jgi:hypothetical protein